MEQTREIKRAILRERIRLARKMKEAGYHLYSLSFGNDGTVRMWAHPIKDAERAGVMVNESLAELEALLAELDAEAERPRGEE